MENNEVMNYEEVNELVPVEEAAAESSGMSTGLAMAIGGILTAGAIAGGKKLKKVWDNHKAKKELKLAKKAEAQDYDEEDIVESEES